MDGPDFSHIDSTQKADALFQRGEVERLFLCPPEFGGADVPENWVYVPVGVVGIKAGIDNDVVMPLVTSGKATRYRTSLEYQGKSVLPIAINIEATAPGRFFSTINIWGDALGRKPAG